MDRKSGVTFSGISKWLFKPQLETPVKTLDIPLAGKNYSAQAMELILNVVHFSNDIKIVDQSAIKNRESFPEHDIPEENDDGADTVKYLVNTKKMLANIIGVQSSSLGLHPAVYCYSLQGRYQITAFLASLVLVKDYEQRKQLKKFTKNRKKFEEFLWKHKSIVNQAQPQWGSGAKGYKQLALLFEFIISAFNEGKNDAQVLAMLDQHPDYNFFKPGVRELNPKHRKTFSPESKTEVFFRAAIESALRCSICGAFLHTSSIQIDHIDAKESGGIGNADNGQTTHPYCNSIKKDLIKEGWLA